MRIQQAQIALESERIAISYSRVQHSLQASFGTGGRQLNIAMDSVIETGQIEVERYSQLGKLRAPAGSGPANTQGRPPAHSGSRLLRPPEFQPLVLGTPRRLAPPPAREPPPAGTEPVPGADSDLLLLKLLIELLSGREIEIAQVESSPSSTTQPLPQPQQQPGQVAQFSIDYRYSAWHYEAEQTSFHATGTLQTADGQEISFEFELAMARSFESYTSFEFHAGTRKDPLVLSGAAPQLSSARQGFDLDGDGRLEQVALPTGDSSFLALDQDGNGRIDSGRELFGALSGNGFAELARHDSDANGFIDANDPVFAQLLAWRRSESGEDRLESLAALGIGALYLGSAATPFELRGPGNESLGAVRRTGIYLNEDGSAGALQQLDLVV